MIELVLAAAAMGMLAALSAVAAYVSVTFTWAAVITVLAFCAVAALRAFIVDSGKERAALDARTKDAMKEYRMAQRAARGEAAR